MGTGVGGASYISTHTLYAHSISQCATIVGNALPWTGRDIVDAPSRAAGGAQISSKTPPHALEERIAPYNRGGNGHESQVRLDRLTTLLPALALLLALSTIAVAQGPRLFSREWYAQFSGAYSQPVAPFRIVGNIYYVGALEHRVVPDRHAAGTHPDRFRDDGDARWDHRSVEQLGYVVSDIRILLASHAHFDHIEGHALMQRRTGAQVMAMTGDAEALESGHDTSALGAIGWEPTPVSRRLKDGDTVTLGGTTLRAIHAPGHTQGRDDLDDHGGR